MDILICFCYSREAKIRGKKNYLVWKKIIWSGKSQGIFFLPATETLLLCIL